MITKRKLVLVLRNPEDLNKIRFEAISPITDVNLIEGVWANNKTPVMLERDFPVRAENLEHEYVSNNVLSPEKFITFCHSIGVECGEFKAKEKYDTSKDCCFLCRNATGNEATVFNATTEDDADVLMYASPNFFVKIELGCLNIGMCMISPKKHILSAAQIPESQMIEYEEVKADVEFILKKAMGAKNVIFFEHGSAPDGLSSHQRSIVHAHTHVACNVSFPKKYLQMVKLQKTDIRKLANAKYFSYQEGARGTFYAVSDPNVYVQRQYPRQVIGELLGIPNELTNWRVEPFEDNMQETFRRWFQFLDANMEFLSERIQKNTLPCLNGYKKRQRKKI